MHPPNLISAFEAYILCYIHLTVGQSNFDYQSLLTPFNVPKTTFPFDSNCLWPCCAYAVLVLCPCSCPHALTFKNKCIKIHTHMFRPHVHTWQSHRFTQIHTHARAHTYICTAHAHSEICPNRTHTRTYVNRTLWLQRISKMLSRLDKVFNGANQIEIIVIYVVSWQNVQRIFWQIIRRQKIFSYFMNREATR